MDRRHGLAQFRAHLVELLAVLVDQKIPNPVVLITKCLIPDHTLDVVAAARRVGLPVTQPLSPHPTASLRDSRRRSLSPDRRDDPSSPGPVHGEVTIDVALPTSITAAMTHDLGVRVCGHAASGRHSRRTSAGRR